MELIAVLLMLGAGVALAVIILGAAALAGRENATDPLRNAAPQQEILAASLLFHIARSGTATDAEALRLVRRVGRLAAPVTSGIDVGNWADAYARAGGPAQRTALLETAVRLAMEGGRVLSLPQYAALLDLSFGLGFQTDALARMRETHGFDYAGATSSRAAAGPLYDRGAGAADALKVLGLTAPVSRSEIGAAYRRLVARHHPDRYHGASDEERAAAEARFIEITGAYEVLLRTQRD